jgi:hypothetical protein
MSGLELNDVIKRYGATQVIHGVDLTSRMASSASSSARRAAGNPRSCAWWRGWRKPRGPHRDRRARRDPSRPGRTRRGDGVPDLRALPAHDGGRRKHGLRPEDDRPPEGGDRGQGRRGEPGPEARRLPRNANPRPCRAASVSASPSGAPLCGGRRCSCSTSRCRTSTPSCAWKCGSRSPGCTTRSARR